jgi:hypothetical protein
MCRKAAEDGFRKLGAVARSALLFSAVTPLPDSGEEMASSLCRRRTVLGLLTEIGVEPENWAELRPLLEERDPSCWPACADRFVRSGYTRSRLCGNCLVSVLPRLPWFVWKEAEEALRALAPESVSAMDAELGRRLSNPPLVRAGGEVLRMLLRLRRTLPRGRAQRSDSL